MARKPEILTLREFLKVRGKQKRPALVYFNEKQWANLTRGLKPTVQAPPPDNTLTFTLTTLPGLDGGLVEIRCPVGGPITGAEGELRCGGKPNVDFPTPSKPATSQEFCFQVLRADGTVSCTGKCKKTGQRCRLVSHTLPTTIAGVTLLVSYCRCG
jgi:hypothetical protein